MTLTDRDRAILDFEGRSWTLPGPKSNAVRERFGLSPSRYRQILNALTESAEAKAYDPLLVLRLRRQRAGRRQAQFGFRTRVEGGPER